MKIALVAAALLAVAPAFATHHTPAPPPPSSTSSAAATAAAQAIAVSNVDVDLTVAPVLVPAPTPAPDITITAPRNAPSLAQGSLVPSGCGAGGNAGGSNTHGAGFLGITWTTDECYLFLLGEKFASIGMPDTACDIWMRTKSAQRAFKNHRPPSCTIPRPGSAKPVANPEYVVRFDSPPLQVTVPTMPIDPPARVVDEKPIECKAAPPARRTKSSSTPKPPVVTCLQ